MAVCKNEQESKLYFHFGELYHLLDLALLAILEALPLLLEVHGQLLNVLLVVAGHIHPLDVEAPFVVHDLVSLSSERLHLSGAVEHQHLLLSELLARGLISRNDLQILMTFNLLF